MIDFIFLRESGGKEVREKERDMRETLQLVASCMHPNQGQGSSLQPCLGIEPSTLASRADALTTVQTGQGHICILDISQMFWHRVVYSVNF